METIKKISGTLLEVTKTRTETIAKEHIDEEIARLEKELIYFKNLLAELNK